MKTVDGFIEVINDNVVICRECSVHGRITTLLFDNIEYFQSICKVIKDANSIKEYSTVILELLATCNICCSTCVASSSPDLPLIRSYESLCDIIRKISELPSPPSALMLSGGEPSIHPRILDIIAFAHNREFKHIFILTNGILISKDEEFVKNLSAFNRLEVYLQFDALESEALLNIRGLDLLETRLHAVEKLHIHNVPTTLVCVLKRGVNDNMVGQILDYALCHPNIRGVTFQPIRFLGRVSGSDHSNHNLSITEVMRKVICHLEIPGFKMQPHPLSAGTISIGYLHRSKKVGITQEVLETLSNDSDNYCPNGGIMFPYPSFQTSNFSYEDIFRIAVFAYQDRYTYTDFFSKQCTVAFWSENNILIPIDKYYLDTEKP